MVREGKFREDLFYRLNVVPIRMPSLRERKEDIPLLADAFLKEFAGKNGKNLNGFDPGALEAIMHYRWPGNVRELRAAIEGAVVLGRQDRVTFRDLPAAVRMYNPAERAGAETGEGRELGGSLTVEEAERQLIIRALQESSGNRTEAARRLGMSRRTLHRKLHKYHLEGF